MSPLTCQPEITVFVATGKRFYGAAQDLVEKLKDAEVKVHHPYFNLDPGQVDDE